MSKDAKLIVGISIGDLNGIGGEVILKALEDTQILDLCTPVIFGSARVLTYNIRAIKSKVNFHGIDSLNNIVHKRVNVLNLWKDQPDINFGKQDKELGQYAVSSLEAATKALKENKIDVLVTAPIDKWNIQSEKFNFPGHTNYLAKELGGESLMLLVNGDLRVGLLTDHVPISEVTSHITPELIRNKVKLMADSLLQDFGIRKPKIAVLGLNPHSGDRGVIGKEDEEVILPTLESIRHEEGTLVFGPYAADSFFGSDTYSQFDGILACYHDQGLVAFKTMSFGKGVNFTAGLNRVRTSPDHGTAYDIAGKGIANADSFLQAIFLAIDVYRKREEYKSISENPLKPSTRRNLRKNIRKS
ncbi:MAG TPA: 4-hydroxythreonine-4-phosphate dehydrogenase PdxA [Flavobacteriaceae bacterium]|nr:4-hydroxythreonine-4-phosphate dehydrogenase PdxA [Flavobacteriaceae bacterium]